jgi:multidrug efflux system outer membrane protein
MPGRLRPCPALPQGQGVYPAADAAQTQDLARIGWREFFRDDRLRQVIELGLANNQDLRLAVANVQAARAQYRAQRADLFPAISASGSGTYTNTASFAASAGGAASGVLPISSISPAMSVCRRSRSTCSAACAT